MKVQILRESGYGEAMLGLSLSYGIGTTKACEVSKKLYNKDGGHNKFLEQIQVWMDITAARYWWQQFDTYRVGMSKQSGSTMHTLMKRDLTQEDFESPIRESTLKYLNTLINIKNFDQLKVELPEGFLQRRIVCCSYKSLRAMISQRQHHKLREWHQLIETIFDQAAEDQFLADLRQAYYKTMRA